MPKVGLFLDWSLERMWPAVSAMAREFRVGPSQVKVGQVDASQLPWRIWGFLFSQWVVFGSLMMFHAPPEIKGQVDIGQASLTSKAQVSLEMWRWFDESVWIPQMGMMNMTKFQLKWKFLWSMLNLEVQVLVFEFKEYGGRVSRIEILLFLFGYSLNSLPRKCQFVKSWRS